MLQKQFDLIISDEGMALYEEGRKVVEGYLTAFDIIEHCGIPMRIQSASPEWAKTISKFPSSLEDVEVKCG